MTGPLRIETASCSSAYGIGLLLLALWLSACSSHTERAARLGTRHGLAMSIVHGRGFDHQAFYAIRAQGPLYVFIEGDGSPWIAGGTRIAADPTPRRPLALELAVRTPRSVLYLGRPCYFGMHGAHTCTPAEWTSARYSERVVESMTAAVNDFVRDRGLGRVVLIGYSGGGTLAVLMAPRLATPTAVVTIAGNLDVGAWTRQHDYLPLNDSLDPATVDPLPSTMPQLHFVGDRDTNVPPALNARYFDRPSPRQIVSFPNFDHVCCWVSEWPRILAQIDTAVMDATAVGTAVVNTGAATPTARSADRESPTPPERISRSTDSSPERP